MGLYAGLALLSVLALWATTRLVKRQRRGLVGQLLALALAVGGLVIATSVLWLMFMLENAQ